MTTPATLITSARYDLRDTTATYEWSDAELLNYLNRAILLLDITLSDVGSERVHATDTSTTLVAAAQSVATPTGTIRVRSVWDDEREIEQVSLDYMHRVRKRTGTNTGSPQLWALEGANIIFDYIADVDYADLIIHYDKATGELGGSGTLPYNDRFNEIIRQAVVIIAKQRNDASVTVDAAISGMFEMAAMSEVLGRNTVGRKVRLNF